MPTYEYQCKTCNHRFETWQKMADEPLTICPECGNTIRRVLFPAGIVFKGHGFYKTDHSGNSVDANGHNSQTTKSEDAATSGDGEKKTSGESKPAESSPESSSAKTSENQVPVGAK